MTYELRRRLSSSLCRSSRLNVKFSQKAFDIKVVDSFGWSESHKTVRCDVDVSSNPMLLFFVKL